MRESVARVCRSSIRHMENKSEYWHHLTSWLMQAIEDHKMSAEEAAEALSIVEDVWREHMDHGRNICEETIQTALADFDRRYSRVA